MFIMFPVYFTHRLQLKLIVKSVNVFIWNVHGHICASAGIHPLRLGNMHHCVGYSCTLYRTARLRTRETTEAAVRFHIHMKVL